MNMISHYLTMVWIAWFGLVGFYVLDDVCACTFRRGAVLHFSAVLSNHRSVDADPDQANQS
jgi:hypothetical protein